MPPARTRPCDSRAPRAAAGRIAASAQSQACAKDRARLCRPSRPQATPPPAPATADSKAGSDGEDWQQEKPRTARMNKTQRSRNPMRISIRISFFVTESAEFRREGTEEFILLKPTHACPTLAAGYD